MEEDFLAHLEEVSRELPQHVVLEPGQRLEKRVDLSLADVLGVLADVVQTTPTPSERNKSK